MINPITLYQKLQPYKVTDEKFLPYAYRSNGGGRTTHDDWFLPGLKSIKRIDTAYMIPQPMRLLEGNMQMVMKPYQFDYPLSPDAKLMGEMDGFSQPQLWVYNSTAAKGETNTWGRFACYLSGEWVECFYTSTQRWFGKDILNYRGLKSDFDPAGWITWYPEASFSIQ